MPCLCAPLKKFPTSIFFKQLKRSAATPGHYPRIAAAAPKPAPDATR